MKNVIKKIIREEISDFDWVDDIDGNIWDTNDHIVFDTKPTTKEFYDLIKQGLQKPFTSEENRNIWEREIELGDEKHYDDILKYYNWLNKYATLSWDKSWGVRIGVEDKEYVDQGGLGNFIMFSDYKSNVLMESNDFEWINEFGSIIYLEPQTLYYAEPPLTPDEVATFFNNISHKSSEFSEVISNIIDGKLSLSYFVVHREIDTKGDWSWGTHNLVWAKRHYFHYNKVDIRDLI